MMFLGYNEFMILLRNPLYLRVIFVAFLVFKAVWVQMDIGGAFHNGVVETEKSSSHLNSGLLFEIHPKQSHVGFTTCMDFPKSSWNSEFVHQIPSYHNESP